MNPNNMTDDPNHQSRPSIFFENYPPTSTTINWTTMPGFMQSSVNVGTMGFNMYPECQYDLGSGNFQFSTNQPSVSHTVQFPFPIINNGFSMNNPVHQPMRCKRKTESSPDRMCKQLITEEKMTEHMSRLHISTETATSSKETDSTRTQRLYVCDEMRKLQTDSILPQSLLSKINRPCTALVLWQPPASILPVLANELDDNENNNEAPDNNVVNNMDFEM